MHLSEGILSGPVVVSALAVGAGLTVLSLRRLSEPMLPLAAMLGGVFFALGTIHIPVGPGSVHLLLNGLLGVFLGWAVFPVMLVALILQAALFGFGGFAVLGANLLIMGVPAVAAHYVAQPLMPQRPKLAGVLAAVVGVTGAAALAALLLALSGGAVFLQAIYALMVVHVPVVVVEAIITALALQYVVRLRPEWWDKVSYAG